MPRATTCALCNAPLTIDGEKVDNYAILNMEYIGEMVRGQKNFKTYICTKCVEEKLLTPMDTEETEFKEAISSLKEGE